MVGVIGIAAAIAIGLYAAVGVISERRAAARIGSGRATLNDLAEYTGIEYRAAVLGLREKGLTMQPIGVHGRETLYRVQPAGVAEYQTWFQRRIDTGPVRYATSLATVVLCSVGMVAFGLGHSWGWHCLGGAFWIQLGILVARIVYVERVVKPMGWIDDFAGSALPTFNEACLDAKPIVWQPFGPDRPTDARPKSRFRFLVTGRHKSGQGFYKTMYAIAETQQEAETYLRTYLNNQTEYSTWEVIEVARAAKSAPEADCVCDPGPITLFEGSPCG